MKRNAINLSPPPGLPPPPRLHIARAPSSAGHDGIVQAHWVLTDAKLLGIATHWISSHTYPCFVEPSQCVGCMSGKDAIWKGYSVAYSANMKCWRIVEVTQEAVWSEPLLWKPALDLRGAKLTLWRAGKATNAPVRAKVELDYFPGAPASPVDCLESLIRIWFSRHRPCSAAEVAAIRAATLTPPPNVNDDQAEKEGAA